MDRLQAYYTGFMTALLVALAQAQILATDDAFSILARVLAGRLMRRARVATR